jgi:superoxide reductase
MTQKNQIYKCEKCGNVVEVLHVGEGELVCCGEPMKLFPEKSADKATEKHVPVIEKTAKGWKVTVGSTLHPMLDNHFIEWIELVADGVSHRKFLKPGDQPAAEFSVSAAQVYAREWCNLHGLWKGML